MDLATSLTISTAIVMAGMASMTYLRKGNKSNGLNGDSSFKNIHKIITDRLKDFVSKDDCTTQRKSFEHEFELTREIMKDGFKELKETIKNGS